MDPLIARFDAVADGDLTLCPARGVAWQTDMAAGRVDYGRAYWERYQAYDAGPLAGPINAARVGLVDRNAGAGATVVDVGIGAGGFIRARPGPTLGTDLNPLALAWLEREGRLAGPLGQYRAFALWDVIEHLEEPGALLRDVPDGSWLFCSLPVFPEIGPSIRASRHYKPGEHLYYWTEAGFRAWMAEYRFETVEVSDAETAAGRDSIRSFAFRRTLAGYHDTIAQYAQMHSRTYGASATGLHLERIAAEVRRLEPRSIVDYGCGRSDLVAHFWADGRRRLARYDPAIPAFKTMPEGRWDLALCCDVMEHIRLEDVDRVLREIRALSRRAIFTISLRPARARLPDGRNAHVTLLSASEWMRWIDAHFGKARRIDVGDPCQLMIKTFS